MTEEKETRQWVLVSRPNGVPTNENIQLVDKPLQDLEDGEFRVQVHYISVDPYQRGRMSDAKSYAAPVEINGCIIGSGVGTVTSSKSSKFKEGARVQGTFGWQTIAQVHENAPGLREVPKDVPIELLLSVLGGTGLTAYYGFLKIIEPEPGKTLFVSGAAGAVGSVVGMIGKMKGLRVIGSAGSAEKLKFCKSVGFDEVLNYKKPKPDLMVRDVVDFSTDKCLRARLSASTREVPDLVKEINELAPEGIDYYFDNTGGNMTDAVVQCMNTFGRISVCGQISMYNSTSPLTTTTPILRNALFKQIRIEGFIVTRWFPDVSEGVEFLQNGIKEGKIKMQVDITEGIENTLEAFLGLFTGQNIGKKLVKVSSPPS